MKVVVAAPLYPPEPGGPATYAKALEQGLSSLGDEVQLVKFTDVRNYPKIIRHVLYFGRMLKAGKNADVILALDPVSTGLPASLAARILHKPFVVKVVGDFAWEQGQQRFGITAVLDTFVREKNVPFPVQLFRMIQTHVAKSATKIIVPSEYLKNIITVWGIDPQKVRVIYNAIEPEEGGVVPAEVPTSHPRIVTTGRLVPWKGIPGLIDAVAEVATSFPDVTLMVVGDGPDRMSLASYAAEKLPGKVMFVGAQTHANTLAIMKDSDVFVLNSSYEGLSHVLVESLILGCTTVASMAGGNPEVVTDNDNGLLVPVGDTAALVQALTRVVSDEGLRARLKARALETSARFSISTMLTETHEFLSSLT